ncbi:D-xylulose reductase [Metarhizium anisopliae BRIP 53293]|uniref:L-arabinitol 4-dehydrogenase n=1 Tax=Metarhizium anisopliae BRIP 53293 TaxID=1291518 RepID=A0A0D9NRB0_METAN|nr:D-xylulose reductase [Metarhizium anisopliae BRIP 53293]KJK87904.1 D-xylulose reductase [Metarhizium anisopliae BRIP 53284]
MTLIQPRSIPNHSQPKNEIDLIRAPVQPTAGISQWHTPDTDNSGVDLTATTTESSQDSLESAGKSNLSFILKSPHHVEFAQRPVPKISTPHEVLIAVNYTGICGSDIHYWEHGRIGHFKVKDPMVLGHESSGTVIRVGSAVKSLAAGDKVAIEPGYPCRRCDECLAGRYNLCPDIIFAATPPNDGTLAVFWVAPCDFCYKLPDHVSLQEGAIIEPLAVAVHIVKQAHISPGASVVVMGAGPVGLLCAAVARCFGAFKVVSVDIIQAKLNFAKTMGSTHTYLSQRISAEENAKSLIDQCSLGNGADVVIDASGAEASIQASLHVVKVGGTFIQGGMGKSDITFPIMEMCQKEVTARGSFRYGPGDFKLAVELVSNGSVDVQRLITGVVPFKQAEEAFHKAKSGETVKMLIAGPNEAEHI